MPMNFNFQTTRQTPDYSQILEILKRREEMANPWATGIQSALQGYQQGQQLGDVNRQRQGLRDLQAALNPALPPIQEGPQPRIQTQGPMTPGGVAPSIPVEGPGLPFQPPRPPVDRNAVMSAMVKAGMDPTPLLTQMFKPTSVGQTGELVSIWRNQQGELTDQKPQDMTGWTEYKVKSGQALEKMSQQTLQGVPSWEEATDSQKGLAMRLVNGDIKTWDLDYRGPNRRGVILSLAQDYAKKTNTPFSSYLGNVKEGTAKYFASGQGAKNATSLNTAIGHMDDANDAFEKLANIDVNLLNTPLNVIGKYTKNGEIIAAGLNLTALQNELATAFKGSGATNQEIQEWRTELNTSLTLNQWMAANQKMVKLLGSRIDALEFQQQRGLGQGAIGGPLISPKSKSILEKVTKKNEKANLTPPGYVRVQKGDEIIDVLKTDLPDVLKEGYKKVMGK